MTDSADKLKDVMEGNGGFWEGPAFDEWALKAWNEVWRPLFESLPPKDQP